MIARWYGDNRHEIVHGSLIQIMTAPSWVDVIEVSNDPSIVGLVFRRHLMQGSIFIWICAFPCTWPYVPEPSQEDLYAHHAGTPGHDKG